LTSGNRLLQRGEEKKRSRSLADRKEKKRTYKAEKKRAVRHFEKKGKEASPWKEKDIKN